MNWTNYHHLLYFYTAVKQGGVGKAAKTLHVSQPTVSKLISTLESEIEETLWEKKGRGHRLTDAGETVFQYAEEIFSLGLEMRNALKGGNNQKNKLLTVGINQALPKLIAARMLTPLRQTHQDLKLKCIEGPLDDLLFDLSEHRIDMILSDAPAISGLKTRGFNHLLMESEIGVYSTQKPKKNGQEFPYNLENIPFILPSYPSALRQAFDDWCLTSKIEPNVIAECDDSGLMKTLGAEGLGAFIAPIIVEKEIIAQLKVKRLGALPEIRERVWLISAARKVIHPVIKSILDSHSPKNVKGNPSSRQ